jgi:hypothetical protein
MIEIYKAERWRDTCESCGENSTKLVLLKVVCESSERGHNSIAIAICPGCREELARVAAADDTFKDGRF